MSRPKAETDGEWRREKNRDIALLKRRGKPPTVPVGGSCMWFTADAPAGFVFAEGQILNVADYPRLAALFGSSFGGNGTTTFGVPDMRGRAPVGQNPADAQFDTVGEAAGSNTHTMTVGELAPHGHQQRANLSAIAAGGGGAIAGMTTSGGDVPGTPVQQTTVNTGSGTPFSIVQASRVVKFIIRAA